MQYTNICSQDVKGINLEKTKCCWDECSKRAYVALILQRTMRFGSETAENCGSLIIYYAPPKSAHKRPFGGVAIILSPAVKAASGSIVLLFGDHMLAIKLKILDAKGKPVTIFLVAAYTPDQKPSQQIYWRHRTLHGCFECKRSLADRTCCKRVNGLAQARP